MQAKIFSFNSRLNGAILCVLSHGLRLPFSSGPCAEIHNHFMGRVAKNLHILQIAYRLCFLISHFSYENTFLATFMVWFFYSSLPSCTCVCVCVCVSPSSTITVSNIWTRNLQRGGEIDKWKAGQGECATPYVKCLSVHRYGKQPPIVVSRACAPS